MDPKEIAVTWYVAPRGTTRADWFEFQSKLKSAIKEGKQCGPCNCVQGLPDRWQTLVVIDKN